MKIRHIAVVLALATDAGAQTVAGRVTDRGSGEVIAGVVVSGLDSNRTVLVRAVTDLGEGFRLPVLPGVSRVQFRKIGYAPAEVALRDTVNGRLDAQLDRLPTKLPLVKALAPAQCDAAPDRGPAFALWEEARSGMLASIIARESKAAWISILAYQFDVADDKEVSRVVQRVELASAANAFIGGADPQTLASDGYLSRTQDGEVYLGPDDVVLFDDSFLATHCFSLSKVAAGDDSTLGIHFEPAKGRKVVEVQGDVWLRRNPLEIKSAEYEYVNVPRFVQRSHSGGTVTFLRMPNGITMIQEWRLRSALALQVRRSSFQPIGNKRGAATGRLSMASDPVLSASEAGALIELMQWPNTPTFVAPLATVSGRLRDVTTKKPLAGITVDLDGTPFKALTDSTGAFTMLDVLPGMYPFDYVELALVRFGVAPPLAPPHRFVTGHNDLGDVDVEGPDGLVKRVCKEKVDSKYTVPGRMGTSAILGLVNTEIGGQVPDRLFRIEVRPANLVAGSAPLVIKGKSDSNGRFRICGVPEDGTITIITDESRTTMARVDVTMTSRAPYRLVYVTLRQRPAAVPPPRMP